jgi:hypothetical protein
MRRGTVVLVIRAFAVGIFVTCGALQGALGAEERVNVDQGWSDKQKGTRYTTLQGSRLIPLSWIRALEQPGPSLYQRRERMTRGGSRIAKSLNR